MVNFNSFSPLNTSFNSSSSLSPNFPAAPPNTPSPSNTPLGSPSSLSPSFILPTSSQPKQGIISKEMLNKLNKHCQQTEQEINSRNEVLSDQLRNQRRKTYSPENSNSTENK